MIRHFAALSVVLLAASGCRSPFYADQGALAGGLTGAGVGALIGDASGNALPGAALGAGIGAISGGLIGGAMDEVEAKNRAMIAAQMGQQLPPGGVTVNDIVAMTRSGVDEELIVNHICANGVAQPVQAGDLITLQQQGISKNVISAMQTTPPRGMNARQGMPAGGPVGVPVAYPPPYPYYYPPPPPYWGYGYYGPRPHPRVGWGVSFSGH